jgi:hypothetical protein
MARPRDPPGLGGELEPPGGRHGEAGHFANDGTEPAVTQPFLETGQHALLVAGFHIDDPAGSQTGLGQGRGKQVLSGHAPEDLALGSSSDTGGEQRDSCPINGTVAAARHLVQGAQREPAAR